MFEAFWSWAEKIYPTVFSKTQLGKAFEYAFKRREYLGKYFENGNCAILHSRFPFPVLLFIFYQIFGCLSTALSV